MLLLTTELYTILKISRTCSPSCVQWPQHVLCSADIPRGRAEPVTTIGWQQLRGEAVEGPHNHPVSGKAISCLPAKLACNQHTPSSLSPETVSPELCQYPCHHVLLVRALVLNYLGTHGGALAATTVATTVLHRRDPCCPQHQQPR